MTYFILYIVGIASIWWVYRVGWTEALKTVFSVLIPSLLIILFYVKAGRLIFKNPLVGITLIIPTIGLLNMSRPAFTLKRIINKDGIKILRMVFRASIHPTR